MAVTRDEGSAHRIAWIPSAGLLSETGAQLCLRGFGRMQPPKQRQAGTRLPFGVRSQSDADEIVFQ